MEQLFREVRCLASDLEREVRSLSTSWATDSTAPNGSRLPLESVLQRLGQIDSKLSDVKDDTEELVRRVPPDLGELLADLKRGILQRLSEATGSTCSPSAHPTGATGKPTHSPQSAAAVIKALTPQERTVFQLCFQSGFLTYREIADHLDISPSSAKNLVNRLFASDGKRTLFAKKYSHGMASVGIRPGLEKQLLTGRDHDKGSSSQAEGKPTSYP